MKIVYVGPLGEVEVPSLGMVARYNEPVEVPGDAAKALCEQDCWRPAPARSGKNEESK